MKYRFIIGIGLLATLFGCATTSKQAPTSQLQLRMAQMEDQLDIQDDEINALKSNVEDLSNQVRHINFAGSRGSEPEISVRTIKIESEQPDVDQNIVRVPVTAQDVQRALKGAGYYQGAIDGKIGSGSMKAIKDFQADHDLVSDGIVGKKTWAELKNYLE